MGGGPGLWSQAPKDCPRDFCPCCLGLRARLDTERPAVRTIQSGRTRPPTRRATFAHQTPQFLLHRLRDGFAVTGRETVQHQLLDVYLHGVASSPGVFEFWCVFHKLSPVPTAYCP
jgi:hypothetical protein